MKWILCFFAAISFNSFAALNGKVISIHDGDTLTLLTEQNQQVKVRLAEIDTPESAQPFGSKSRQMLADMVFSKQISVDVTDTDRYGRKVGKIYLGDTWVNREMVKQGGAWVYRQYSHSPELLADEANAKSNKLGLWSLPESERMPPWEWRKNGKKAAFFGQSTPTVKSVKVVKSDGDSSFSCGGKNVCRDMDSCEEAYFYLEQCGLRKLDRDHDGIPCESICGG